MDASGPDTVYVGVFSAAATAGRRVQEHRRRYDVGAQPRDRERRAAALEADPSNPGTVFMGALGGPLRKTTDGGATWTISLSPMSPIGSVQIDPTERQQRLPGDAGRRVAQRRRRRELGAHDDADRTERVGHRNSPDVAERVRPTSDERHTACGGARTPGARGRQSARHSPRTAWRSIRRIPTTSTSRRGPGCGRAATPARRGSRRG